MRPKFVQPVSKEFRDAQEVARAILEIQHLVSRVESVPPETKRHDDPEIAAVNNDVTLVIARVFGTDSVQFIQLGHVSVDEHGGPRLMDMSDRQSQELFVRSHASALALFKGVLGDLHHQQELIAQLGLGRSVSASPPAPARAPGSTHIHQTFNAPVHGQVVGSAQGATFVLEHNASPDEVQLALVKLLAKVNRAAVAPEHKSDAVDCIEILHEQAALPAGHGRKMVLVRTALSGVAGIADILGNIDPSARVIVEAIRHWFGG